jgi:hypothetical protein
MALPSHHSSTTPRTVVARVAGVLAATAPSEGRSGLGCAESSQQGEPFGRVAARRDSSPCSTPMIHHATLVAASTACSHEALS